MSKNIILFSDGTGNSSGKLFKTNVWRTYQAVDVADPQRPHEPIQVAFYDDGVGTSSFKPLAILGGAAGLGLARNVRDLYAFVCRNYQHGDKIYAFGFSRGAFTIRVLIDFILKQGLVPYGGNEAALQRGVAAAYRAYRAQGYHTLGGLARWVRVLRDGVIVAKETLCRQVPYAAVTPVDVPAIEFLGLWDTVDAYGLPIDELTRAVDRFIWPMLLPDLVLDPRVLRARHALSVDDERNALHPRLWNEAGEACAGNTLSTHIRQERISQVWFAGVHSDVGGGYPDDGLAYVSLNWIMQEAAQYGLRFCPNICDQYRALADETGPLHDSRHGVAGYYRYNPRRIDKLAHQHHDKKTEVEIGRSKIHESVLKRITSGHDGYAPIVLPPGFAVVKIDGGIEAGATYLGPQVVTPTFAAQHEHVWNWVWWRRGAYFLTVLATLALVAMPLIWPALPKGACTSRLCFVSHAVELVASFLPAMASPWTDSFASHPDVMLLMAAWVLLGLAWGSLLERQVRDAMRALWYSVLPPRLQARPHGRSLRRPCVLNRLVEWLRTRRTYAACFHFLTHELIPFVFLLAVAYGALALVSQVSFAVRSSWGWVCAGSGELKAVSPDLPPVRWPTRALCTGTGVVLQKGATYRLRVTITNAWFDASVPAGPNGVQPQDVTPGMTLGVLLRRHLGQPWFKPMARIHNRGTDVYPLDPQPTVAESPHGARERDTVFETEFVARTEGELFLYVNDAVLSVPFWPDGERWFYNNNRGAADVRVERLQAQPDQADRP